MYKHRSDVSTSSSRSAGNIQGKGENNGQKDKWRPIARDRIIWISPSSFSRNCHNPSVALQDTLTHADTWFTQDTNFHQLAEAFFRNIFFERAIKLNDFRPAFLSTVLVDASSWKLFLLAQEKIFYNCPYSVIPTKILMLRFNYVSMLMLNCGYFETTFNYPANIYWFWGSLLV